jgi:hypothetical protein
MINDPGDAEDRVLLAISGLRVVIVGSVALYAWMQKKDRDGVGGWLAALSYVRRRNMLKFSGAIVGALLALLRSARLFAGTTARQRVTGH